MDYNRGKICKRCNNELEPVGEYKPSEYNQNYCVQCHAWNEIFDYLKCTYENDEKWLVALNDIDNLLKKHKPDEKLNPVEFISMLNDRGLSISSYDIDDWNLKSVFYSPWMIEYEYKKCKRCNLELGKTDFDITSVHDSNYCGQCHSWNVIFNNFKELHSDSNHWLAALDDMENILKTYKPQESPDPTRFSRMLYDRGLNFSDIDKRAWNLSADQCLPFRVTRHISDDKVKQFVGKIFGMF